MEYGILTAESDGGEYQIIGAVDSPDEARELMQSYFLSASFDCDCPNLAPDRFVIHRRGIGGWYTRRETVIV